jgi:short-subunit dehydrogenase
MSLERGARLVVDRGVDVRALPLTPGDFFLFSRVEALGGANPPTVGDVIAASGQASSDAEQAILKLIGLGLLTIASSRPVTSELDGDELRKRARERKRGLLAAQLSARSGDSAARPSRDEDEEVSLPAPRENQKSAEPTVAQRSILETIEPVAADDQRLDPALTIPLERQRRLLALRDRLRHVGHFEILGLTPVDDVKLIRRAYHVISRELHPDAHFGKDLGRFHAVLDDLFRRARSSYEFLLDAAHRKTLVDSGGRMQVLLNNAGVMHVGPFEAIDPEQHRQMIAVNLQGVIEVAHAGFTLLSETPGARLINMSSASAIYGMPEMATYSATKHAVRGLTEALDIEWERFDIRVCDVMPIFVDTELLTRTRKAHAADKLGVHLQARDVAEVVWAAATSEHRRVHWPVGVQTRLAFHGSKLAPTILERLVVKWMTRAPRG